MNDLIFLIIIWIVIALFNAFVKKLRSGQSTAKPARPSSRPAREEPRLPPFLEELFGMGKEEAPSSLPVETAAVEEIPHAQPPTPPEEEEAVEEYSFKMPLLGAAKTENDTEASAAELAYRIPLKKRIPSNLKAAVIWREILDLPVSLRKSPFAALRK